MEDLTKNKDLKQKMLLSIAQNIDTPKEVLFALSMHPDENVRATTAKNKNINIDLLKKLSKDLFPIVRINVALNSLTPSKTLKFLMSDENKIVQLIASDNFFSRN